VLLDSVLDDSEEIQPIYLIDIRCVDFEDLKRFIIMSGSSETGKKNKQLHFLA